MAFHWPYPFGTCTNCFTPMERLSNGLYKCQTCPEIMMDLRGGQTELCRQHNEAD